MYSVSLKYWLSGCPPAIPTTLYVVGGTVRDLLLGGQPKDIDLVCRGARDFAYRLGECKKASVVAMEKKPDEPCYRVVDREDPENYLDIAEMRGATIYEDLQKRDFTINAIAAELYADGSAGPLLDPFSGALDLEQKTIKMTSSRALISDPLRVLRALRFSAMHGFGLEPRTREEMGKAAPLLKAVSGERIAAELLLILKSSQSSAFIREMDYLGILDVIIPEILPMKGCAQNGFHHKDVWEHSLLTLENCEEVLTNLTSYFGQWAVEIASNLSGRNRVELLKLTALLHDIGKPQTMGTNPETQRITFYNHARVGSGLAGAIAERLKLSSEDRAFLVLLVAEHLHPLSLAADSRKATTRMSWFRKIKEDIVPVIILGISDVKSSLGSASTAEWRNRYVEWSVNTVREYYETLRQRLASPSLVTGRDLIALGMRPGPEMGQLLDVLRNAQDTGEIRTYEAALAMATRLLGKRTPG